MSTGGQTYRDVIINLKVQTDTRNAGVFQSAADAMKKTQETSTRAVIESLSLQRQAGVGAYSVMLDAAAQYQDSLVDLSGSVAEFRGELGRTALGAIRVGRGFVELGVASEENMEKAVRMLARFQGTVDIVRGTAQTVQGVIRAYDSWRRSIEAVTAAQTALKAVQVLSAPGMGGGASGGFGSFVGDVAGGAIGGRLMRGGAKRGMLARVGGAVGRGVGALARTGLAKVPHVAGVLGGLGAGVGITAAVNKDYREGLLELTGWTNKAADAQKQYTEFAERRLTAEEKAVASFQKTSQLDNQRFGMRQDLAAMKDRFNPLGSPVFRQMNAAESKLSHLNRQLSELDSGFAGPGGAGQRAIIQQQRAEVFKEIQNLTAQELQHQQRISDERMRASEETMNILKSERDKALGLADSMQGRQDNAIRRFGAATPGEQASFRRITEAMRSGQPVHAEEARYAESFGFVESTQLAQEVLYNKAVQAGVGDFTRVGDKQIGAQRTKAEQLAIQVKAETALQIQISENREGITKQLFDALDQLQDKKMKAFEEHVSDRLKQIETNQRNQKLQQQSRRSTGGF